MEQNDQEQNYLTSLEMLEGLYGEVAAPSILKEVDHIHPVYQPFIEAASFVVLASAGPQGLDASPRGDAAGFVQVEDARTLYLPDRRGNNRLDTLRNVLQDPRVALLFLIPGIGETLRINGTARIAIDPALLARFEVKGQRPRTVLEINVTSVYFQCSRAVVRAGLWDAAKHLPRSALPSPGTIFKQLCPTQVDGEAYDQALPQRIANTLY
ncbi:pyridoxamine 5'-phosphate oxidase family protein [Pseudomonas sp. JUb52]|uniref:pyridoxamine 5'-phosphate oxidase family protein n=1 Tax=Pseudomonas sp. JUb52 TaxID=2485127 RepID=UPI00104D1580|nr:pyridoxamine 5'-phosphate oxidase family protein [Pseudomonas sp. JUb52]TCQ92580.1 hypothetical protein EC839_102370 [Pseudomonas sp. JUb52]